MNKLIVIGLIILAIYFYYQQNTQPNLLTSENQEQIKLKDQKISDLEQQLINLAQQKLADKKEAQQLAQKLESYSQLIESKKALEEELKAKEKATQELEKKHQDQLRQIYTLFDLRAHGMKEIEFDKLMETLKGVKKKHK